MLVECCVERNRDSAGRHDAQIRCDPKRAIRSHDRAAYAFGKAGFAQPAPYRFCPAPQLPVGETLHLSGRALHLRGHAIRKLLYRLGETTVSSSPDSKLAS